MTLSAGDAAVLFFLLSEVIPCCSVGEPVSEAKGRLERLVTFKNATRRFLQKL